MAKVVLMEAESADGNYPSNDGVSLRFKKALIACFGTFGSATVTLEMTPDGGTTWEPVKDSSGTVVSITADTVDIPLPYIPSTYAVRANIAGATGGESLSMILSN